MKIATIVGARPQFVKASVVSRCLSACLGVREIVIHTGQHYDPTMNAVFFEELDIPQPDYWLGVGSGSHGQQTGRMLEAIEQVLLQERPSLVIVYGDTNSTLAGALAAAKLHIPVAHVEAGLRSYNRRMPEEINRLLTDHLSTFLFAPTPTAMQNLLREGIESSHIHVVGDVMYDAALYYGERSQARSTILQQLSLAPGEYALATVHRAENTDCPQRLTVIMTALQRLAEQMPVVLPLHPRTRNALSQYGITLSVRGLRVIDAVGYLDMIQLERSACIILTDSGGVQKEAFFYRKPCVTLRDETEWVELVELGWNCIAPPVSVERILEAVGMMYGKQGQEASLYGDGQAGQAIVRVLLDAVWRQESAQAR